MSKASITLDNQYHKDVDPKTAIYNIIRDLAATANKPNVG